jgi:hypothetical protein
MSFNLYRINFQSENIIDLIKSHEISIPKILNGKINLFYNITSNLYYQKQFNRKGIRNLGAKIRHDENLKEVFTPQENICIVKATSNKLGFTKLFIDCVTNSESNKIYLLVFSKNFNKQSQMFDTTSTSIEDISHQLKMLNKFCGDIVLKKDVFVLEITSYPNHQFIKTYENYSRIIELNHGKNY